jgi:hypothetical protein
MSSGEGEVICLQGIDSWGGGVRLRCWANVAGGCTGTDWIGVVTARAGVSSGSVSEGALGVLVQQPMGRR